MNANAKNLDSDTSLLISSQMGHLELVKYLIEEVKVDPS